MLKEVISLLDIKPGSWYVDCNLGGGGHTSGILQAGGKVLGVDLDHDAISEVNKRYQNYITSGKLIIEQANFINLEEIINKHQLGPVAGILFDLGVSSYQLEQPSRGFSFNTDSPLDMRMDQNQTLTAADLVNGLYEKELAQLFSQYGDEHFAIPIAKKIVEVRQRKKIETTAQLAQIILSVRQRGGRDRTHPATRVFQALRIAVNDELGSLKNTLPKALHILQPGGRLVIISFHSLEDRIVKIFFKDEYKNGSITILTQKPIIPTKEEVLQNPRSRSGKLRAAQKV